MTAGVKSETVRGMGILLCVLLGTLARAEDPVYFDDQNLKTAVEQKLGKIDPTPTDMLSLLLLDASYSGISKLTGLEYAKNLQDLDLRGNKIRDIYPLTGLTQLLELDLRGNPLYPEAYTIYIPQIKKDNPGIVIYYDRPPEVSTYAPSLVTETSAILEGSVVNDGGQVCEYRFRYWREGDPNEHFTDWQGSLYSGDFFADRAIGLIPGRLYHVEAQARNSVGDGYGEVRDFNTTPAGFMTLSSTGGGSVTVPGEGRFMVRWGTSLRVVAIARQGWRFVHWTGTAIEAGKVIDPNSAVTTVILDGEYTLCAHFVIIHDIAYVDDNAPGDLGAGDPLVSDPNEDGSPEHPFDSIQEAVLSQDTAKSQVVIILAGRYTGQENREIDLGGRSLLLKSSTGPGSCVIDCQGLGRAFYLHSGENSDCVIEGLTILNGFAQEGGAVYVASSHPTIKNCIIEGCRAVERGGGLYCGEGGCPTLLDSMLRENQPEAIYLDEGMCDTGIPVEGTVRLIDNDLAGSPLGNGKIHLKPNSILELRNCDVSTHITGSGAVVVPVDSSLTMIGNGLIRLVDAGDPDLTGLLQCEGVLHVTGEAFIQDTTINMGEGFIDGNAVLSGNRITIHPDAMTGLRLSGGAKLENNLIESHTDQYLSVDLNGFTGRIAENHFEIIVDRGTLFEVRAKDLPCTELGCDPCAMAISPVPDFNTTTWTIDSLHIQAGDRLRLVDRFNDQQSSPRVQEAIFVKKLILEANSILDVGRTRLYYEIIEQDPTAQVVSQVLLGFSLGFIDFEDPDKYAHRISTNNFDDPTYPRHQVTREPNGLEGGFMHMQNLEDKDPCSPTFSEVIYAQAKVRFARCAEDRVLVKFKYLFETTGPNPELVVSLSDVPEMLEAGDPNRALHYKEVGRLSTPSSGGQGSPDSHRYSQFEQWISTYGLDLTAGTWVELELKGVANQSSYAVSIDDLDVEVEDCGGICMDLNRDSIVDEEDFMLVMSVYGQPAGLAPDLVGSTSCMEGLFSKNGYIDCYDVFSWDWTLKDPERCNLCAIPTAGTVGQTTSLLPIGKPGWLSYAGLSTSAEVFAAGPVEIPGQILILGKRDTHENLSQQQLEDRVYVYDEQGQYGGWLEMGTDRCSLRMIRDGGSLYMLNSEAAVCRIRDGGVMEPVVPPGRVTLASDPRYGRSATISIGIQTDGSSLSGRPLWDAAFTGQYGYVAPVVVLPDGRPPYQAAAKLELKTGNNPPYRVVKLYDDPVLAGEGVSDPNATGIREIEVDGQGSVFVVNADSRMDSDVLWAYRTDGQIQRLILDSLGIHDPIGLCVSNSDKTLYIGCGCSDPTGLDSTVVYGFSTEDLSLRRTVKIHGMQFVTAMVAHPRRNVVWVVGLAFKDRPLMPSPSEPAFYQAFQAVITPGVEEVQAIPLAGTDTTAGSDLALPTSIVWMGF